MNKPDIESILLANWYFINCKYNGVDCDKSYDMSRKYLVMKINKVLTERSKKPRSTKTFFTNIFSFI